jgi:hypothetical protein
MNAEMINELVIDLRCRVCPISKFPSAKRLTKGCHHSILATGSGHRMWTTINIQGLKQRSEAKCSEFPPQ